MNETMNATKHDTELTDEELEGVVGGVELAPGPCRPELFVTAPTLITNRSEGTRIGVVSSG